MISRQNMKGVTRCWIYCHEASTQNGMMKVVRATSRMEMPSTPTTYWMLKRGIQACSSAN